MAADMERNQGVSLFERKTREETAKLKAIRIHKHGGSDQLRYEDTPGAENNVSGRSYC